MLKRLGVCAAEWKKRVRLTNRRFTRELELMPRMFAEATRRGNAERRRRDARRHYRGETASPSNVCPCSTEVERR